MTRARKTRIEPPEPGRSPRPEAARPPARGSRADDAARMDAIRELMTLPGTQHDKLRLIGVILDA